MQRALVFLFAAELALLIGCSKAPAPASAPAQNQAPAAKTGPAQYQAAGEIVDIDASAQTIKFKAGKIEGWMDAMTMAYSVDKPEELQKLTVGDHIEATVYQDEYKLYNIRVNGRK